MIFSGVLMCLVGSSNTACKSRGGSCILAPVQVAPHHSQDPKHSQQLRDRMGRLSLYLLLYSTRNSIISCYATSLVSLCINAAVSQGDRVFGGVSSATGGASTITVSPCSSEVSDVSSGVRSALLPRVGFCGLASSSISPSACF